MKKIITTLALTVCTYWGFSQSSLLWAKKTGGTGTATDQVVDLRYRKVGTTDQLIKVGFFSGTLQLSSTISLTAGTTDSSMYVARYDASGTCTMGFSVGNANVSVVPTAVDIANDGSILVAGYMKSNGVNTVDFNPSATTSNLSTQGGFDIFYAKYNSSGGHVWSFAIAGTQDEIITDIAIDQTAGSTDASFYVTGTFESLLRFDPLGNNTYRLLNTGVQDIFLGKYALSDGAIQDVKTFGTANASVALPKLKVNNTNIVLCGQYKNGALDMDPGTGTTSSILTSNASYFNFMTCYTKSTLAHVWTKRFTFGLEHFEFLSTGDIVYAQESAVLYKIGKADGNSISSVYVLANTGNTQTRSLGLAITPDDHIIFMGSYWTNSDANVPTTYLAGESKTLPSLTFVAGNSNPKVLVLAELSSTNMTYNNCYIQGGAINQTTIDNGIGVENIQAKENASSVDVYLGGNYRFNTTAFSLYWDNNATSNVSLAATNTIVEGYFANYRLFDPCTTPTVTAAAGSRCGAGTVTIGATPSAGTISWYATASGGSALGTGNTFTTPSISATTTYYAEAVNSTCVSARVAIQAIVNTIPTITGTGASRCGTGTVVLSATASAGTVSWFAASTGGSALGTTASYTTPSISATTTYYAQANNNGCASTSRAAVIATVNTIPTIAGIGETRCGAGSIAITATPTPITSTISWFATASGGSILGTGTSYTTPSISATTTYYTEATNNGCVSASRTAVVATVNSLPTVTATGASRCGTGTIALTATPSAGIVSWFAASSGGAALSTGTSFTTPSISTTTTYYAEANNGCLSSPRTAVVATVNATPSSAVTLAGNTITATEAGATYQWINCTTSGNISGATSQSYTAPSSGNYKVTITKNTCSVTSACTNVVITEFDDQLATNESSKIYPNPNNGDFTIEAEANSKIEILNQIGQLVKVIESDNKKTYQLTGFESGVYIIKNTIADKITLNKVIVQN